VVDDLVTGFRALGGHRDERDVGGDIQPAANGAVIGRCYPRHGGREFLSFLHEIERNVPPDLDVDLVMDNYATHKTEPIQNGSARGPDGMFTSRPRWFLVNQVERFFVDITEKQIGRPVHRSTAELETAIRAYFDAVNADPKPSAGPNPPTTSSPPSSASASTPSRSPQPKSKSPQLQYQDTSLGTRCDITVAHRRLMPGPEPASLTASLDFKVAPLDFQLAFSTSWSLRLSFGRSIGSY
jgi:hypothetical protein